jgi:protein mago nashi
MVRTRIQALDAHNSMTTKWRWFESNRIESNRLKAVFAFVLPFSLCAKIECKNRQEFEVCPSGKLRYANNSNYKDDSIIRREVCLGPAVVTELKRIIRQSKITTVDDEKWGEPPETRRWELEIKIGNEHICFNCAEITSLADIRDSPDPIGLTVLYYLTQDLKCFVLSLINLHFKVKPIPF